MDQKDEMMIFIMLVGLAKKLKISPAEFSKMMTDVDGTAEYIAAAAKARIDQMIKSAKSSK